MIFFKNQTLIPFPMKTYVSLFGVEVGQGNTYIFGRRFKPKKYRNKRNTSFIMLRKMCFTSHHSFPTFITVGTAWIMSWWSSHARFKTNSRQFQNYIKFKKPCFPMVNLLKFRVIWRFVTMIFKQKPFRKKWDCFWGAWLLKLCVLLELTNK